jgi:HAD superfamily hydrolase (TIGR01490 family)
MTVAFLDLDKTVLSRNSGALWVRWEVKRGHIRLRDALRAYVWFVRYQLGAAQLENAILEGIRSYAGTREEDVLSRTRAFYERRVRHTVRPGALKAIAEHRRAGERVVLLTSSSNYLAQMVTHQLGLDGFLSTRYEVDASGRYTGRPEGTLCFGAGKVLLARSWGQENGVQTLADCSFYSDSASDLPMLEAVGRPVAVNPDPWLWQIAFRRGWPVRDWGEPEAGRSGRQAEGRRL